MSIRQKEKLREIYRKYYDSYKFNRKQYQENGSCFTEYVKKLEAVCALDEVLYNLDVDFADICKEIDKEYYDEKD